MSRSAATLAYEVVDVFTDRALLRGNPLAVVLDADDLPAEALQAPAAEFALSETAFPLAGEAGEYGLRIFTPAVELAFAGHPSVGAAWVLHRLGRLPAGRVVQSCGAGRLDVEVSAEGARLAGGPPHPGAPLDPAPLLAAVGLEGDDVAGPAALAGCGSDFAYLLVRPEAVARAVPDVAVLHALLGDLGLSVTAWDGHAARSRVFHPSAGVAEDPATGSAAVGLGVHLAAAGLLPDGTTAYDVHQGAELGRPSLMHCTVRVEDGRAVATTVGGSVVPVASGNVQRPCCSQRN